MLSTVYFLEILLTPSKSPRCRALLAGAIASFELKKELCGVANKSSRSVYKYQTSGSVAPAESFSF